MDINNRIEELGSLVNGGMITWQEIADKVNEEFGVKLSKDAIRKRYKRRAVGIKKDDDSSGGSCNTMVSGNKEYETCFQNGEIEAQKIVEYNKEIFGDKKKLLNYLGFNADEWEFVYFTTSAWNQHTKEQTTKNLYAVKFKVKPLLHPDISLEDALESAKKVFKKAVKPLRFERQEKKVLNKDKLMEIPAVELHLGKYAEYSETGQDYSTEIAKERFYHILKEIIGFQEQEKCDKAVVMIGNDFFNSDTVGNTTTKGTPQTNDIRWKSLFMEGLELYRNLFIELRKRFNVIDVRLCQGNHDTMSSFYLYIALSSFFKDDKVIKFSENYREYQCYQFGNNAIFFGHGDGNLKRIIKSIPAEFYKEWGESKNHELHLGHLHSEICIDDESGMITRRIGSPTATDSWHYSERFIGATQKHQIFVWHKTNGLENIKYINFDKNYQKKLTKKIKGGNI